MCEEEHTIFFTDGTNKEVPWYRREVGGIVYSEKKTNPNWESGFIPYASISSIKSKYKHGTYWK